MKLGLGPDSVIPKRFYFVYNVFCFGLMHHYRVSGPRSAKKVAPSKEVPIGLLKNTKQLLGLNIIFSAYVCM